ncbi:MAG: hypothetical protein U0Q16_39795, partial [Bryobacteraceae bacterium]
MAGKLKEGAQHVAPGTDRFRSGLIVLQVTLGLVLLVGAELLTAGFVQLVRRDPGFRRDHLLTFNVGVSEQADFGDRLLERLGSLPGVQAAAMPSDRVNTVSPDGKALLFGFDDVTKLALSEGNAAGELKPEPYLKTGYAEWGGRRSHQTAVGSPISRTNRGDTKST